MAKPIPKTGFDKFLAQQMRSESFARAYADARAEIAKERAQEKQRSREEDARALTAGEKSRADLQR
jgi:hypothetical protein